MPKINDYSTPRVGIGFNATRAPAPAPSVGRSIQNLGNQIADTGDMIYRRKAQEETSEFNAAFAEARADFATQIDEETRSGTIDTEKINERVQDYINNLNQDISTAEGRRMFEREAAALKSYAAKASARSQAQVAGARAEASWRTAIDKNSSALVNDPSTFEEILSSTLLNIDDQVAAGAIPAPIAEKFKLQTGRELAKGAVRGWANMNPEIAQKKLDAGEFDQFFDSDVKAQMQGYINQQNHARAVEINQREKQQEEARKKAAEAWEQKALPGLVDNSLTTKDVLAADYLSADQKKEWLKLLEHRQKEASAPNHALENELFRRIHLPDEDPEAIRDVSQISYYVGRGLNIEGFNKVSGALNKSPEGKANLNNRKQLMDYATAKLVKKDAFGQSDPRGEQILSAFMVDLQAAEAELRKEGKPVAGLYNPRSPDYFGNKLDQYTRTQKDIMQEQIQAMRRKNTGSQLDFLNRGAATTPRKPGESAADWLKRKRQGGG